MSILYNKLKENFTQIPNELLTDNRLSMGAKVVFCYVASKPTGWKVWNNEIQKALNIKDSGTIAKYWKELLETGWIERERTKSEDGKIAGGYDYTLMISPKNHIRENTTLGKMVVDGKNPCHSNTDLSSKTKINNNTNKLFSTNEISSNTLDNNLLDKPKTKKQTLLSITQTKLDGYSDEVLDIFVSYCNERRKTSLSLAQWSSILDDFTPQIKNMSDDEIIENVKECTMRGYRKLFIVNTKPNDYRRQPKKSNIDSNMESKFEVDGYCIF